MIQNVFFLTVVALLVTRCVTYDIQESHFFHPGPAKKAAPTTLPGAVLENVTFRTADGTTLGGAYIKRDDAGVEILYFGGNVSRVDDAVLELNRFIGNQRAKCPMMDYSRVWPQFGSPVS